MNIVQNRCFKIFEYILNIGRCTLIGIAPMQPKATPEQEAQKQMPKDDRWALALQDGPRLTTIPCKDKAEAEAIHAWLEDRLVNPEDICPI